MELLSHPKADVNLAEQRGVTPTPLWLAAWKGHVDVMIEILSHRKIKVTKAETTNGYTPLCIAFAKGHVDLAKRLQIQTRLGLQMGQVSIKGTPLKIY